MSLLDQLSSTISQLHIPQVEPPTQASKLKKELAKSRNDKNAIIEDHNAKIHSLELQKKILKEKLVKSMARIQELEETARRGVPIEETGDEEMVEGHPPSSLSGLTADDVTSLQNQLDTLLPEYLELQKQHQMLKDDFANLEETYKASLQDLDDCEARCKIVEGNVNSVEETNRQLKDLLTQQEADCNKDLLERKEKCTKLTQELELSNNKLKAHKQKHRENSRALSTQITQLTNENKTLQENTVQIQLLLERHISEGAVYEQKYKDSKDDQQKRKKEGKNIRRICTALQFRLKSSEEQLKKVSAELEQERETSTNLGLRVCDLERRLRSMDMEHSELKKDCSTWEHLYLEAKSTQESLRNDMDSRMRDIMHREKEVFALLDRIVCLKDTLDNMKIEVVRHQTPGLKDLERLEFCQRNIQLLVPEIKRCQRANSNDNFLCELATVLSSLVMQLANHQQLINRFLARALGAKPIRRHPPSRESVDSTPVRYGSDGI